MPVTLTDEQVAQLRSELEAGKRARNVEDMVNGIWNDQLLGADAKALFKRKYPDVPIEGYDQEQRLNARLDAAEKERKESERKQREQQQDDEYKAKRKETQERHGFTDDAMQRLEKMMVERNIGNYEDAAELMAAREPRPSDDRGGTGDRFWGYQHQDTFKKIATDPEKWAYDELLQAARNDERRSRNQY